MLYKSYHHGKTINDKKIISFSNLFSAGQDLKEISTSLHVKTYNTVGKHKLNTEDLTKQM